MLCPLFRSVAPNNINNNNNGAGAFLIKYAFYKVGADSEWTDKYIWLTFH